jgi:HAD superfamily phosphoserine phosphatase-like hydrolase
LKTQLASCYLVASDFDQTLSFNDSGHVLAEMLGVKGFDDKVAGLARSHLVQQGGELAYLIRHDPEFRHIRREHLIEAGKRVHLRNDIPALMEVFRDGIGDNEFTFVVLSAAPREIVVSALEGIVPPDHIYGTEFDYDPRSGEVRSIKRVRAGYGKVAAIDEIRAELDIAPQRVIYVGDGSSDVHVMLHVNNRNGFTIAVSENLQLARIATSTVLSASALAILGPMLEQILRWKSAQIGALFESRGLTLAGWERARTDRVTIEETQSMLLPEIAIAS